MTKSKVSLFFGLCLIPNLSLAAIEAQPELSSPHKQTTPVPKLTRAPELIQFINAPYPKALAQKGIGGEVHLLIDIDVQGLVTEVQLISTPDPLLGDAALAAAAGFIFRPAEVDHQAQAIRLEYRYIFEPNILPKKDKESSMPASDKPASIIQGLVREAGTRKPIADAVVLLDQQAVTQTNALGEFTLFLKTAGSFQIRVASPYFNRHESIESVNEGEALQVKYYLLRKTHNPFTTIVRDKAAKRSVTKIQLKRDELRKIPGTLGDPVKVIENLPGVSRTPGGLGGVLLVRGEHPSATNIFIDGVSVPLMFHFFGLTSILNVELYERIDFYPGGFSARFGDATAGIVDIRTRDLNCDMLRGVAEIDLVDTSMYICTPIYGWHVASAFRRSYIDLILPSILDYMARDQKPDQGTMTLSPMYWDYQVKAHNTFGPHVIDIFAFGSNDRFKLIQTGSLENTNIGYRLHMNFHRILIKHNWQITRQISLRSSIAPGSQRHAFARTTEELESRSDFNLEIQSLDWREDLTWELNRFVTLRTGVDHRAGQANFRFEAPINTEIRRFPQPTRDFTQTQRFEKNRLKQWNQGYYAEILFLPWPGVKFIPGIRFEQWRLHKTRTKSWLPRLNIRWAFSNAFTAKTSVGLFARLPDAYYLIDTIGNPNLLPEQSWQNIGGFEYALNKMVHFDLQVFYNIRKNLPAVSKTVKYRTNGVERENWVSTGKGHAVGLEVLLRHLATPNGWFYGWISYTLSRSIQQDREPFTTYKIRRIDGKRSTQTYNSRSSDPYLATFDQTHILTLVAQFILPYGFELGGRFRLVSGNPFTPLDKGKVRYDSDVDRYRVDLTNVPRNSNRAPLVNQLDIRLDRTWIFDWWKLAVFLEVLNVYNAKNVEMFRYDYRYEERVPVTLLPILPVVGVKGSF